MVRVLRVLLRLSEGRAPDPSAAVLDSRALRSTPESGHRGGCDRAKRKKGSKVHAAVDTLGHLLGLHETTGFSFSGRVEGVTHIASAAGTASDGTTQYASDTSEFVRLLSINGCHKQADQPPEGEGFPGPASGAGAGAL